MQRLLSASLMFHVAITTVIYESLQNELQHWHSIQQQQQQQQQKKDKGKGSFESWTYCLVMGRIRKGKNTVTAGSVGRR